MSTAHFRTHVVRYFKVPHANLEIFKALCRKFTESISNASPCVYYGFSFNGEQVHCREGYQDAAGMLAYLGNVNAFLVDARKIAEVTRLEVHGPASEVEMLRGPLAEFNPQCFVFECSYGRQMPVPEKVEPAGSETRH